MAEFWYDGTNGNDTTGDGSIGNPYRTIGSSTTGGTVDNLILHLKRGTTVNQSADRYCSGTFLMDAYGDGDMPVFSRTALGNYQFTVGASTTSDEIMRFENVKIIDVSGSHSMPACGTPTSALGSLQVFNCVIVGFYNAIIVQNGTGSQNRFIGNHITDFRNNGIYVSVTASGTAMPENVLIIGNYVDGRISTGGVCADDCIVMHDASSNGGRGARIAYNVCIAGTEGCVDIVEWSHGSIVEHNVFYSRQDGTATDWADVAIDGPNCIFRNNLLFKRYRRCIDIQSTGNDAIVENNTIVEMVASNEPLIRLYACENATIRNNLLVNASGSTGSMIIGVGTPVLPESIYNNILVNNSASTAKFINSSINAEVDTWSIDGNVYVQMPGSTANAWTNSGGACSWANWLARPGAPDANSIAPLTALPVSVPAYVTVGDSMEVIIRSPVGPDNPIAGVGVHLGYMRDAAGVQRPNPPSAGPFDIPTQRRALDSDPSGW